jgi:hypothetical protein
MVRWWGLNWLSLNTHPELLVLIWAYSWVTFIMHQTDTWHLNTTKHILSWLSSIPSHGIQFTQGGSFVKGLVSWVDQDEDFLTALAQNWTDATYWVPQDASHLKPERPHTITEEDVRFILSHCVLCDLHAQPYCLLGIHHRKEDILQLMWGQN